MIGNFFSGSVLDRAAALRRDEDGLAVRLRRRDSLLVPVWRSQCLVNRAAAAPTAGLLPRPLAEPLLQGGTVPVFLGLGDDIGYFALDLSDFPAAPELDAFGVWSDLRLEGSVLPRSDGALLAYARGITHWHRTHRFCGRCGSSTSSAAGGHVRRCDNAACATKHYPRTDPAVIMLVTSGDYCLLGRQPAWPTGMVSTLAGFVEPGETPEEAVIREVMEETGVRVEAPRYHSSQPWPFPGSLMIGFAAESEGRPAPVVDPLELEIADWFSRAEIRDFPRQGRCLPGHASIARRLIEDWLDGE